MCPLVLEQSHAFGLNMLAGTSAARAQSVCRSCYPSVRPSRIMIIRSPTNACMLLKTKRVLSSKYYLIMLNKNLKIAPFSGSRCLYFWAAMAALYKTSHTSIRQVRWSQSRVSMRAMSSFFLLALFSCSYTCKASRTRTHRVNNSVL